MLDGSPWQLGHSSSSSSSIARTPGDSVQGCPVSSKGSIFGCGSGIAELLELDELPPDELEPPLLELDEPPPDELEPPLLELDELPPDELEPPLLELDELPPDELEPPLLELDELPPDELEPPLLELDELPPDELEPPLLELDELDQSADELDELTYEEELLNHPLELDDPANTPNAKSPECIELELLEEPFMGVFSSSGE